MAEMSSETALPQAVQEQDLIAEARNMAHKATMLGSFSSGASRNAMMNFAACFSKLARALEGRAQAPAPDLMDALQPFIEAARREAAVVALKSDRTVENYLENATVSLPPAAFLKLLDALPAPPSTGESR